MSTAASLSDILDEFITDGPSARLLAEFVGRWPEREAELVDFYSAWIGLGTAGRFARRRALERIESLPRREARRARTR
jgi:hypothetical protein